MLREAFMRAAIDDCARPSRAVAGAVVQVAACSMKKSYGTAY